MQGLLYFGETSPDDFYNLFFEKCYGITGETTAFSD